LTIQERLDIEDNAYRPHRDCDCGEIGRLSAHNQEVDPFFNLDVNQFPTGAARGHDMLLN
jgi:hypothetical protein